MSLRAEFNKSQKRRAIDEESELQPSTSRMRNESPTHDFVSSKEINEFSESDMSDNEYEEVELDSEDDYERDDDYLLRADCVEACKQAKYPPEWKRNPPANFKDSFAFQPADAHPTKFDSEGQAFFAIMDFDIIEIVVEYTNRFMQRLRYKVEHQHKPIPKLYYDTDHVEIQALMGLWLKLGVTGFHCSNVAEIFSSSRNSSLDAHLCLSIHRYKLLMRALRFDDKLWRARNPDGTWKNPFVPIQDLYNLFTLNCRSNYSPGEYLTVDEMLLAFRGRCSFRMYIPTKKAKFGIKIFCLVDPSTMYQVDSEVYYGKKYKGPKDQSKADKIVMRLTEDYQNSGRTIVTDNYFTSSSLGNQLYETKTFLLGTLRKDRTENPKDFMKVEVTIGKAKFVFREHETIMKFQARKSKPVNLYSTKHHSAQIHSGGKPQLVIDYNATKFGVDIFDEMCRRYAYAPLTQRWPLKLFMHMVDVAAINAYVLFEKKSPRRDFINNLADQLMRELKEQKSTSGHWRNKIYQKISNLYDRFATGSAKKAPIQELSIEDTPTSSSKEQHSSKTYCYKCGKKCIGLCRRHPKPRPYCAKHRSKTQGHCDECR